LEERLKFHRVSLENCASADGLVVVIDVLRAFSTAAYAFAAGAEDIHLVSTIEQAFSLKGEIPDAKIMGEVDGLPVDGFDFGNSPPQFDGLNLRGVHLIQRTSSGTQGVVKSELAEQRIATGFCTAGASIKFIQQMLPEKVTFLITGLRSGGWGDEDQACADFIEAILSHKEVDPKPYLQRVRDSKPGRLFQDPDIVEFPVDDLEYCLAIDRFDFVMPVQRSGDNLLMKPVKL